MWERLNKFFGSKEEAFPRWADYFMVSIETLSEKRYFAKVVVDELSNTPIGHKIYFKVNGAVVYAVKDREDRITIKRQE